MVVSEKKKIMQKKKTSKFPPTEISESRKKPGGNKLKIYAHREITSNKPVTDTKCYEAVVNQIKSSKKCHEMICDLS